MSAVSLLIIWILTAIGGHWQIENGKYIYGHQTRGRLTSRPLCKYINVHGTEYIHAVNKKTGRMFSHGRIFLIHADAWCYTMLASQHIKKHLQHT